jgi:hypothetical protein
MFKKNMFNEQIGFNPISIWDYHPTTIDYPRDDFFSGHEFKKREIIPGIYDYDNTATKKINYLFKSYRFSNKIKDEEDFNYTELFTSNLYKLLSNYIDIIGNIYQIVNKDEYEYSAEFHKDFLPSGIGYTKIEDKEDYFLISPSSSIDIKELDKIKGRIFFEPKVIVLWLKTYELMYKMNEEQMRDFLSKAYNINFALFKYIYECMYSITIDIIDDVKGKTAAAIVYCTGKDDGIEGYVFTVGRTFDRNKLGIAKGSFKINNGIEETPAEAISRELAEELGIIVEPHILGKESFIEETSFKSKNGDGSFDIVKNYIFLIKINKAPKISSLKYMGETTSIMIISKQNMEQINKSSNKNIYDETKIKNKFNNITGTLFLKNKSISGSFTSRIFNTESSEWIQI